MWGRESLNSFPNGGRGCCVTIFGMLRSTSSLLLISTTDVVLVYENGGEPDRYYNKWPFLYLKPGQVGLWLWGFFNEEAASRQDWRSTSSICLRNPMSYCNKSRCRAESPDRHLETHRDRVSGSTGVCEFLHGWGFPFTICFKKQLLVQIGA